MKIGIDIDAVLLKKQIQEEKIENKCNEDSIYDKFDDIWDYVDKTKHKNLKSNEYYNNIKKELMEIYSKYPRVEDFIERSKIVELNKKEVKALRKYLSLADNMQDIELVETFKLGLKDSSLL